MVPKTLDTTQMEVATVSTSLLELQLGPDKWVSEWVNECVSEWMSEWVSKKMIPN
jgi:hypothetical protein